MVYSVLPDVMYHIELGGLPEKSLHDKNPRSPTPEPVFTRSFVHPQ